MARIFVLVALICTLQFASCRVARDSPVPTSFSDLAKQAEEVFGTLHSKFLGIVGVKNDQELTALVQRQGKVYADKLQTLAHQLGQEAKTNAGRADDVVRTLQQSLNATITELKTKNPDVFASAEKFQENFQEQLKTVLKDTEQLNAKLKSEATQVSSKVEEVLKQIYDSTVQTAQKVVNEIEVAAKKAKSH